VAARGSLQAIDKHIHVHELWQHDACKVIEVVQRHEVKGAYQMRVGASVVLSALPT